MGRFEIELDDKGEFVGDIPVPLKEILTRTETMAYGNGVRNGKGTADEAYKKQLEETLRTEKAKWESQFPLEREKWQQTDADLKATQSRLLDLQRESASTLRSREEAHAQEILNRAEAIKAREAKIRTLVNANLKSLAAQAGAREESLPELEVILGSSIGFDDHMEPFIKGPNGDPLTQAGKPISVEAYVKQYIDNHPHHRKPAAGRGGDARGGASLRGSFERPTSEAAVARIQGGDRGADAINALFEANRKKAS